MNIILPENFTRYIEQEKVVFIEEGILYMKNTYQFKRLMMELAYAIYGNDHCYCCGSHIPRSKATIDHIIPQDYGGPDITNNMIPYCEKCNSRKTNLMPKQHDEYLAISSQEGRRQFAKKCNLENENLRYDKNFSYLCDDENGYWVKQCPINKIKGADKRIDYTNKESKKCKKYEGISHHYSRYNRFQKPLIVDRNMNLLGGYETLRFAKERNRKREKKIETMPVIILENVQVFY